MIHLTPELSTLVAVARNLPSERVREVTDFAEFLVRRYPNSAPLSQSPPPVVAQVQTEEDDDVVDLGVMDVGKERLDLSGVFSRHDRLDLSGVYSNVGMHSAIGMV